MNQIHWDNPLIAIRGSRGVGKTTLAVALSRAMSLHYKRMQFTPDVLPSDILGFSLLDTKTGEFVYRPGAIFTNIFLADEINRTSPKTQSALLEVMEEGSVSVDGVTRKLDAPFFVIATQNPTGASGTQKLPEWLKKHTGKELAFTWTSGTEFAQDLTKYALVIHCGGCMLNEREMQYRKEACLQAGVPMTNYGMAIAHMNGILKRSLAVFQTPVKRGEKE